MLKECTNTLVESFWLEDVSEAGSRVPIQGTLYGIALHAGQPAGASMNEPAPIAPVLFIKPRNTFLHHGGIVCIPRTFANVEVSATLGIVFGCDVRRAQAAQAFEGVHGFVLAIDISEAGAGIFRPPIREKCRDGFLPIGPAVVAAAQIGDMAKISLGLEVDGMERASFAVSETLDDIARSIEEVSSFMTFQAGDVLLISRTSPPVIVQAGSEIAAVSAELGRLECSIGYEEEAE